MSFRDYSRKSIFVIIGWITMIIVSFIIIGLMFTAFGFLILIGIPITMLIFIGFIFYRYFGESKKSCPRCNFPISIYTEYCRNCGLKLINKCPICNIYTDGKEHYCDNCGYEFPEYEGVKLPFEYKVYEAGDLIPDKPNFCPTCGASMKNAENLRFCEFCGSKIA